MTPVRLLLNSGFTGANAFFALAERRGLFRDAELQVAFTPGRGAYTAAARLDGEGFDAAYGDINALIELAACRGRGDALPLAVFMAHQQTPSTLTVARAGPIRSPADLLGCHIVGHASDVALRTFAAYARRAALATGSLQVATSDAGMQDLLLGLLKGHTDAVFGYLTTHTAALASAGLVAGDTVSFLPYRDVCPELYGSALMVAPKFLRDHPAAVHRLVQCVHAGILGAQAEPQNAVDALLQCAPGADRAIELQRWIGTLLGDIGAAPGLRAGLGNVSDTRLDAAIACLSDAGGWKTTPLAERVFTRRFLSTP